MGCHRANMDAERREAIKRRTRCSLIYRRLTALVSVVTSVAGLGVDFLGIDYAKRWSKVENAGLIVYLWVLLQVYVVVSFTILTLAEFEWRWFRRWFAIVSTRLCRCLWFLSNGAICVVGSIYTAWPLLVVGVLCSLAALMHLFALCIVIDDKGLVSPSGYHMTAIHSPTGTGTGEDFPYDFDPIEKRMGN